MLICPLCQASLAPVDNGVACNLGHRFDRARQGYLNLLPVQHKNSRDPGDNAAMVEARRRFLEGGHYAPLARRLGGFVGELLAVRGLVADASVAVGTAGGSGLRVASEAALGDALFLDALVAGRALGGIADGQDQSGAGRSHD